ncbi:MAG: class I SAM-dependent methyltransferase [Chloroflexota bacterium]|nr:class I SAM-dependent methyltransferase [Chloroflexota bacterium]
MTESTSGCFAASGKQEGHNVINMYDVEPHVAEVYDQVETYADDVELVRNLIGGRGPLRILEPFCGTGRILIPLALDGHRLVGLDQAKGMLARARAKIKQLPEEVQRRVILTQADVTCEKWPQGFDLVILGGNCLYELATPQGQEGCIISAAASLNPGGYVYVDSNHMEGNLDESWQKPGVNQGFPTGTCVAGTLVESTVETIWYDATRRLVKFRRCTKVTLLDGSIVEKEYIQQKHPVSTVEVQTWLEANRFVVEQLYGDRAGNPYTETSGRAIFWARKC